jgi:endonuclease/exonuclease/phosphatase family metal-dependent hydrolase
MPSLRLATWNIAGARRERTDQVDLDAVVAGVRALNVDLLAMQEVDRELARSGRVDQPAVIAQAMGPDWFWTYTPALVGDDFRPLSGPDPGGVVRPRGTRVAAAPVSDHRALMVELDVAAS